MKLVVTGCNGRVGKRVVAQSLARGYSVLGIDVSQPDAESVAHPQFTFVQKDLIDYEVVLGVLDGYDAVVHLAAYPNPMDYKVMAHNR